MLKTTSLFAHRFKRHGSKEKLFLRFVSLALVFSLIIASVPGGATVSKAKAKSASSEDSEEVYVVKEMEEYRDQNSKTYLKSDGSMTQIVSTDILHYEENGEWKEIDNTLTATEDETGYTNTAGDISVTLPDELSDNGEVTISDDDYSVSFSPVGVISSGSGKIKNPAKKSDKSKYKDMTAAEITNESGKSGSITYADAYENSDIRYDVQANGLKESIILDKKPNKHLKYTYTITSPKLSVELLEDNTIEFYKGSDDDRQVIFTMPAPYMFDSENATSYDIAVELEKTSEGVYTLTYTPDTDWLRDKTRVFPVTIDPTIEYTPSGSNVLAAYTTDYNSYTVASTDSDLYVGKYFDDFFWTDINYDAYLYIPTINNLPSGSVILNAQLKFYVQSASSGFSGINLGIREITNEWSSSSSHLNYLTFNEKISDWATVLEEDIGSYISFDITSFYRDSRHNAYSWDNYGVKIFNLDESNYNYVVLESKPGAGTTNPAYIELDIVNQNGYANNSSSRTIDLESAGTVYVNDYTGHLSLIREDIGYDGNVMPIDFKMIYNNYEHDEINMGFGDIAAYGKGWRSNYSQKIKFVDTAVGNPYYEYITEDGSVTYFEKVLDDSEITAETDRSAIFSDTTNGAYTICVGTDYDDYTSLYIKGDINERYYFDSFGRLIKIAGNMEKTDNVTSTSGGTSPEPGVIRIFYVSNANDNAMAISHMYDGAGRKYNFVYKANEYRLWVIQYMGTGTTSLSSVTYEYNDDNTVYRVCQSDGRNIYYTWDNGVMTETKSFDGRRCTFGYNRSATGNYVNEIKLYGTDDTLSQSLSAERTHNSVIYTDNNTGKTESIYFDYNGNAVNMNVIATNSENEMVVASYEKPELGSPVSNLVSYSAVQKTVYNYVKNGYAAKGLNSWTAYPLNSAVLSIDFYKYGTQSFKLSDTAEKLYQDITVTAADTGTYTLSAYVKVEEGGTATISAEGISSTVDNILDTAASTSVVGDTQRLSYTFDVTTAGTVRINMCRTGNGAVYFDGIQLEKGDVPHKVNLVENSGFENDLNDWIYNSYINDDVLIGPAVKTETKNGNINKYAEMPSNYNYTFSATQTLPVSGSKDDVYTFGAWIKKPYATSPRDYDIKARFYNGTTAVGEEADILLRPGNNDWIYMMSEITAEDTYTSLKIELCYNYGFNEVMFDDVQVYRGDTSTTYDYNENGELSSITETSDNNSNDDAISGGASGTTNTENTESFEPISMDSHGRIIKTEDKSGIENHLQYDEYSNPLVQYVTNGNLKIEEHSEFSANGNFKAAEYNELGAKISYSVDENSGLINSVTNAENVTTNFTYDNYKRLKSSSVTVSGLSSGTTLSNTYSYDVENHLKSVNDYNINYDSFGRLNNVKLGTTNLITYNYNSFANGGQLNNVIYANGQKYIYSYDSKGRLKTINNGTKDIYKNIYSIDGNIAMVQYDYPNHNTSEKPYIKYTKDPDGNDTVTIYDTCLLSVTQSYTSLYDKYVETVNEKTYTTNYAFTENGSNAGANWQYNGITHNNQITYDGVGRVQTKTFNNINGDITTNALSTTFNYADVDETKTSNRVTAVSHQANNYTKNIAYTYTDTGKIKSMNGVSYDYNEAGMLTRVNDPNNGTTVYIYNSNGSLHYVKHYAYTIGELGECLKTETYGYDTVWKDKLTSILTDYPDVEHNWVTDLIISYDASGNPTQYGTEFLGNKFTWTNGNQLYKLEHYDANAIEYLEYTLSFSYNPQGLRTTKQYDYLPTAGSPAAYTLKYTYDSNGRITSQQGRFDNTFYFYYDKEGNLLACEYDGAIYYYVTNLQGDVIAILDPDGNCVVEYTYDEWGKVLSITGSMQNSLGHHNPLRYRGYYYDIESQLYYLQSRYYDPAVRRFINADSISMLVSGEKAYTYCNNDPVNNIDSSGKSPMSGTPSEEYMSTSGWTDTILHLGLSTEITNYFDFWYAMSYALSYGVGGSIYMNNAAALFIYSVESFAKQFKTWDDYFAVASTLTYNIALGNLKNNLLIEMIHDINTLEDETSLGKLIYSQREPFIGELRYGLVNKTTGGFINSLNVGNMQDLTSCSCGLVALYNALILMGKKVSFSEIAFLCEISGNPILGGFFGTNPMAAEYIAEVYGLTFDFTTDLTQLNTWLPSSGVIIVTYINNTTNIMDGMHTVAIKKYPPSNDCSTCENCETCDECVNDDPQSDKSACEMCTDCSECENCKGYIEVYNLHETAGPDIIRTDIDDFFNDDGAHRGLICAYYLYDF